MDTVLAELRSVVLAVSGPAEAARVVDLAQRGRLGPSVRAVLDRTLAGHRVDASGHWVVPGLSEACHGARGPTDELLDLALWRPVNGRIIGSA